MSALCRFCCRSPLQAFLVGDSVAVMRFATGAGDDGAAESRPEQFFYSFCLEEAVSDDHPVREIASVLDLSWMHSELAPYYSGLGRPSIDPVLMIRRSSSATCLRSDRSGRCAVM